MIIRRMFLAAAGAVLASLPAVAADPAAPAPQPAAKVELVIAGVSSALQAAQDDIDFKPFTAATGIAIKLSRRGTGPEGAPADVDLTLANAAELASSCSAGLFQKLDWSALGGKDRFLPLAVSDCGVGTAVGTTLLAWDRDKFQGTPTWSDFWDIARYPGKRGLRRSARSTLEIALMADGVAPADVYRTLRTDDGVERAFHKLDQLKPYLVWWAPDTGAAQILKSGEVLLSSAFNGPVTLANRAGGHFGLQWTGSLYSVLSWAIPKTSSHTAQALQFIAFASDPARQAALTAIVPYGPTAKGANEALRPDILPISPTAPANLAGALQVDEDFWRDNGPKLEPRFQNWLAHS